MLIRRFHRIYSEFGRGELIRTLILFVGLIGMAAFGWFGFASAVPLLIASVGLLLGWLLRNFITRDAKYHRIVLPVMLVVYSVVLFLGQRLGMERVMQLNVITVATVFVFGMRFWSLSDPEVINTSR